MTEQEATELGEMVVALAGFMRSSVPNRVGEATVHLIVDRPAYDRLLTAAATLADR